MRILATGQCLWPGPQPDMGEKKSCGQHKIRVLQVAGARERGRCGSWQPGRISLTRSPASGAGRAQSAPTEGPRICTWAPADVPARGFASTPCAPPYTTSINPKSKTQNPKVPLLSTHQHLALSFVRVRGRGRVGGVSFYTVPWDEHATLDHPYCLPTAVWHG